MVKKISKSVHPIIKFINENNEGYFIVMINGQVLNLPENAIINYDKEYLYADNGECKWIIKLSRIDSITSV